jgi:hypothetical protein
MLRSFFAAVLAVSFLVPQAEAAMPGLEKPSFEEATLFVRSDCYAVGQQVAAQNGGTLARASQSKQGGRAVCVIVVLVPGKDGQRPRRREVVVPLE